MENVTPKNEKSISGAIKINEKEIVDHLSQLVRQSVADTINSFLDAEADAICNATRYQHTVQIGLIREQVRTNGNFLPQQARVN